MKWRVKVIESESGWGQKVNSIKEFDTYEEAKTFQTEFNSHNNYTVVPDWYMYAGTPYQ